MGFSSGEEGMGAERIRKIFRNRYTAIAERSRRGSRLEGEYDIEKIRPLTRRKFGRNTYSKRIVTRVSPTSYMTKPF